MTHPVIEKARNYLGVNFRHQGRIAIALDCAGLLVVSMKDLGVTLKDVEGYDRQPAKDLMKKALDANYPMLDYIEDKKFQEGDILLMRFITEPQHIALCTNEGTGIIHSYARIGKVVEHDLTKKWVDRIIHVYRINQEYISG